MGLSFQKQGMGNRKWYSGEMVPCFWGFGYRGGTSFREYAKEQEV